MDCREYLVSYGAAAYFGRFIPAQALGCRRGDRVIVRSHRGLEMGTVLCEATAGHAQLLQDRVGQLLRPAGAEDELRLASLAGEQQEAFAQARRLALELGLPLEIVDVEVLLEPRTFVVHYFAAGQPDYRELVSSLARQFDAYIEMLDLASLPGDHDPDVHHDEHADAGGCGSCGNGGCGSCGEGGCGSCGSGGCGSPPEGDAAVDEPGWQAFFSELRVKMDRRFNTST